MRKLLLVACLAILGGCASDKKSRPSNVSDKSDTIIVDKKYFKIHYNAKHKGATSVTYTLDRDKVNDKNITKRPSFYTEKSLPKAIQTHDSDYSHTGYDRGHIANDSSFDWSEESLKSTYTMANIIPQLPNTNRTAWLSVEKMERYTATQFDSLQVTNIIEYKSNKTLQKKPINESLSRMNFKSAEAKNKYISKYKKAQKYLKNKKIHIPSGFYKVLENKARKFKECYYVSQGATSSDAKQYLIDCSKVRK